MTKAEKQKYLEAPAIGAWSYYGTLKEIQYGIEDYAIVEEYGRKIHRLKINYAGRPYVCLNGKRLYFDECMRMGATI